MDAGPIFTIRCDGGCGRVMQTGRLTTLLTVTTCPDCQRKRHPDTREDH